MCYIRFMNKIFSVMPAKLNRLGAMHDSNVVRFKAEMGFPSSDSGKKHVG